MIEANLATRLWHTGLGAVDMVLLIPATAALMDAWFKGSLFASERARLEVQQQLPGGRGHRATLLLCRFCLSYHAPLWVGLLLVLPAWLLEAALGPTAGLLARLPLASLTATYVLHRLNPTTAAIVRESRNEDCSDPTTRV